jgi:hypothetical protein
MCSHLGLRFKMMLFLIALELKKTQQISRWSKLKQIAARYGSIDDSTHLHIIKQ